MQFIILLFLIVALHLTTIFLDNWAFVHQFKTVVDDKKIGQGFVNKNKILLCSRFFIFLIPPLLGYLINHEKQQLFTSITSIAFSLSLLLTVVMYFKFIQKTHTYIFLKTLKKFKARIFFGTAAFIPHLHVPFYLNYLAIINPENALWIVQISPALTALTSFYAIFYLDQKLASAVDHNKDLAALTHELFIIRILSRLINCLILLFIL